MSRCRGLLVVLAVGIGLLAGAAPALAAFAPVWPSAISFPAGSRTVPGGTGALAVWSTSEESGHGSNIQVVTTIWAQGADGSDGALTPAAGRALVELPVDHALGEGLAVASDGADGLLVAWKDTTSGVSWLQRFDPTLEASYAAVELCRDDDLAAAFGAGAGATLVEVMADGLESGGVGGGCYVRQRLSPSSAGGDTLLNHVTGAGVRAADAPGLRVTGGSIGSLTVDSSGRACVLLVPPGRSDAALDRYDLGLTHLSAPVSLYGSGGAPSPAPAPVAVGGFATGEGVIVAWRDSAGLRLQRLSSPTGAPARLWAKPAKLTASGPAFVAPDATGGAYVASSAANDIVVRRISSAGALVGGASGQHIPSTLSDVQIAGVASDAAGDLWVGYFGVGATATTHLAYLVRTPYFPVVPVAEAIDLGVTRCAGLAMFGDGLGGVYAAVDNGPPASGDEAASVVTARVNLPGSAFSCVLRAVPGPPVRSWPVTLKYGKSVRLAGYAVNGGAPGTWPGSQLQFQRAGRTEWVDGAPVALAVTGLWTGTVKPEANGSWRAAAPVAGGWATSEPIKVGVHPVVSASRGYDLHQGWLYLTVTGTVSPAHAGQRVRLIRITGTSFKTITTRVKKDSTYHFEWMPSVTHRVKYVLQVVMPAHADHLEARSPKVTLSAT